MIARGSKPSKLDGFLLLPEQFQHRNCAAGGPHFECTGLAVRGFDEFCGALCISSCSARPKYLRES